MIAGATDGLVVELAALVDEHPLRERPRALLMEALAAEGRTADALRVFDDFRRVLGDELGIEPSGGLAAQHAALLDGSSVAAWTPPHRLPVAATSLLGRDDLVGDAISLVGDHRVVTLIGPGGVGKSRLAIEVGHRLRDERPSRPVVLIELATATTDSAVEAVAAALAIDGRPGVGLNDRLPAVLGDLEVVLLLDNCEHVLEPMAALVEAVVAGCPNVTMVTTSRERLRVNGEVLCPVPPLGTAAEDDPAVLLFVERAAAVSPGFAPRAKDLARITEIVRRLDGLPLAIELAAARLHTLDVAEVAAGLDRRFRLLSSGSRTSSRHGSLGAAVAWSVGLLGDELRRTFAELSVFAGSFTAADAVAITSAGPDAPEAVAQLAERSLVMRVPGRRYVLLETLRAYGAELLAEDGTADDVGRRHAFHVVEQIEAADRALIGPRAESAARERSTPGCQSCESPSAGCWSTASWRRRAASWWPSGLRVPPAAAGRPGLGRSPDRADAGRPQPARGRRVGGERTSGLDGGRPRRDGAPHRASGGRRRELDGGRIGEGGDDAGEPGALRRSAGRLGAPLPPGQGVGAEPGAGPHRTRLRGAGAGVRRATQRPRSRPPPCSPRWGTTSAPTPPTPGTAPESPTSPATPTERGSGSPGPSISRSAAGHRS